MNAMEEILRAFPLDGEPLSAEPIKAGHIHKSFLVTTNRGCRYVLQQVNRYVFRDPGAIMDNLRRIRDWLRERNEPLPMISFLDTHEGRAYYADAGGCAWRLSSYVENSVCLLRPETPEDFRQSALAFGRFLHVLRDFPAKALTETIPRFHDTPERFRQLREAAEADVCGRGCEVEKELAFAFRREEKASFLQRSRESGELPLHVAHNDTKMSNVLLDAKTREALCVLDLDTVMPGLSVTDFGDAIRAGAATGAEDEGGIALDMTLFKAFTCGFLSACPHLSERERELLPLGAWTMTLECGVRFLTDHLCGDRYFAVDRPGQNLERARAQFSLASDMERKWDEMAGIVLHNS